MAKLKNLSDNSISELQSMTEEIRSIYGFYIHVSDFMPKAIKRELDKFSKRLVDEIYERQED